MRKHLLSWRARSSRCTLGVFLAAALAVLASETGADAQEKNQGKLIAQASKRLSEMIATDNEAGYTLVSNQVSIGGGLVKKGPPWTALYEVTLEEGKRYRAVADGDNDARDVDIRIADAMGKVVAVNHILAPRPIRVDYQPKTTGKYTVQVQLYDSSGGGPCVIMAVLLVKR